MLKIFLAPVGTPMPLESNDDGVPVSLDDTGVTEWVRIA